MIKPGSAFGKMVWVFNPKIHKGVVEKPYRKIRFPETQYTTELEAQEVAAAWLFERGRQLAAELHENEKKYWVAKQRVHELKNGAPEREVKT